MPTAPGISVWIGQNNTLPEHQIISDGVSTCVEVARDGPFSIAISLPSWLPLCGDFMIAEISIDGYDLLPVPLTGPGGMTLVNGLHVGNQWYPFLMLPLSHGKDISGSFGEALGTIVVRIRHARHDDQGRFITLRPPTIDDPIIPQEHLNDMPLSHHFSLGLPLITPNIPAPPGVPVGEAKLCCTFRFRYCDRKTLVGRGFIGNDQRGLVPAMDIGWPQVRGAEETNNNRQ